MTEGSTNQASFETPGTILKRAREKAGISIDDLARELNLSAAKVEALEQDQYEKLASDVFAQGYLRRYGKLVNVDDDLLVRRFNEYRAQTREDAEGTDIQQSSSATLDHSLRRALVPAAILLAALVILALIYFGTADEEGQNSATDSAEPPAQVESVPTGTGTTDEPESLSPPETPSEPPSESEAGAELPETQAVPVESTAPAVGVSGERGNAEPLASAEAGENQEAILAFEFTDDCWLEVEDRNGTVLYAQLATEGESFSLEGEAPFSVMLGNARGVSLSLNDEPVPVEPQPGNRTAKLQVGG